MDTRRDYLIHAALMGLVSIGVLIILIGVIGYFAAAADALQGFADLADALSGAAEATDGEAMA